MKRTFLARLIAGDFKSVDGLMPKRSVEEPWIFLLVERELKTEKRGWAGGNIGPDVKVFVLGSILIVVVEIEQEYMLHGGH